MSRKSIYLINPTSDHPAYYTSEVAAYHGFKPLMSVVDLPAPTIAAMAPTDFDVSICEEAVSPVDFDTSAAYIGITGKIDQSRRMKAIAAEFRARGKTVIIGGPAASLDPTAFRSDCDILVRGEAEDISAELFADLAAGTWRDEYVGNRPDLSRSPAPRWELYPHDRAFAGAVQTARGCPFSCDYCSVGSYVGPKQRHKPPAQVVSELDALVRLGMRRVFFADDNFTARRSKTKELLETLIDWNRRQEGGRVAFETQLSVESAEDESLLQMLVDAGFDCVYIGLETPDAESLHEARKFHNLKTDMADRAARFIHRGMAVASGLMVGFDKDGPDVFERQYQFAMSTAIPIFCVSVVCAPPGTALRDRLARENRLVMDDGVESYAFTPYTTNIIPRKMTREQLLDGAAAITQRLYHPTAFGERLIRFIEELGEEEGPLGDERSAASELRKVEKDSLLVLSRLPSMGPLEKQLFERTVAAITKKPAAKADALRALGQYMQVRMMIDQHLSTRGDTRNTHT